MNSRTESIKACQHLRYPLYDGDVSPVARNLLVQGDIAAATNEFRRLADLGSGLATCVLAYLYLRGTAECPKDLEAAKRLATSALSTEKGYASYILGYVGLAEGRNTAAAERFSESATARFLPGIIMFSELIFSGIGMPRNPAQAERLIKTDIARDHYWARTVLLTMYWSGQLGLAKKLCGSVFVWIVAPYAAIVSRLNMFRSDHFVICRKRGDRFSGPRRR